MEIRIFLALFGKQSPITPLPMRLILLIPFCLMLATSFAQSGKTSAVASETNFFGQLTEDSSPWKMEVQSSGCFHFSVQHFEVLYQNGQAYLNYQEGRIEESGVSLKLSEQQLTALAHFEQELRRQSFSNGCTSVSNYQLIFGEESFAVRDGSCGWRGFYDLMKELKLRD